MKVRINVTRYHKAAAVLTALAAGALAVAACGAEPAPMPSPTPDLGRGVTVDWVRGGGPRPHPDDLAEMEGRVVPVHFTDCHGTHLLTVDSTEYAEWHEEIDYITLQASEEAGCLNLGVFDRYVGRLQERGLDPAVLEENWRSHDGKP